MCSPDLSKSFQIASSPGFAQWLSDLHISLAFSTYQLGKIFFVGVKSPGRLSVFERTFNRCMGLWTDGQTIWLASAFQLWRLENVLEQGATTEDGYDRLFVPQLAHTTGDIDVHDIAVDERGNPLFVNTLFSCLATSDERLSFTPTWRPPFVTKLAAEDRCHLNGLAMLDGRPEFVTACAESDQSAGWRSARETGGCLVHVHPTEVILRGLSMPHSPRIHDGHVWLLDSGTGYLVRVHPENGRLEQVAFCPGYGRGLAFVGRYAVIGVSKPREATFAGLPLDRELTRHRQTARCGLIVIDCARGIAHEWLWIEGAAQELYDVVVLPDCRRPKALGLKTDEIQRNVWFEHNGQINRWSAKEKDEG